MKMKTQLKSIDATRPECQQVIYTLSFTDSEDDHVILNDLVGTELEVTWLEKISCLSCDKTMTKPYGDGLCSTCFFSSPSTAECVLRPALCRAHEGMGRDVEWERTYHDQPHYVYLALTSRFKVGVTRDWPTRWIDQGADEVKVIAETPYRQLAGLIEVTLSEHYSDKTPWQRMLKGERLDGADIMAETQRAISLLPEELAQYYLEDLPHLQLVYPSVEAITKVKSQKLSKVGQVKGRLVGIKGQYLIFEEGKVMNIRSHSGFHAHFKWEA